MAAEPMMDKATMKRLLTLSKKEPVSCAVGMGADPQLGLLMLDKIKQPKAVEREMMKAHPETRNERFGTAVVDTEIDPKLVRFHLNRAAPGMARRLVKTLKGTGFSKVEIVLEDGTVAESAGEAEDESAPVETPAPQPVAPQHVAPPPVESQPVETQAHPQLTPALLTGILAGLMKRVQAYTGPAEARAELIKLAQAASAHLKAGELEATLRGADALRHALDAPVASPPPPVVEPPKPEPQPEPKAEATQEPPAPLAISPVKLGKASLLWRGMWAKADKDMKTLEDAVITAMEDDDEVAPADYATIQANLKSVTSLTTRLNISLADALDLLINTRPDALAAPLAHINRQLDDYTSVLEQDEMIGLLADNEFHPVSVKADLLKAVQTIRAVVAAP